MTEEFCEAHLERVGKQVPVYRMGLCRDCYYGKQLLPKLRVDAPPVALEVHGFYPVVGGLSEKATTALATPRVDRRQTGEYQKRPRKHFDKTKIEFATYLLASGKSIVEVEKELGLPFAVVNRISNSLIRTGSTP